MDIQLKNKLTLLVITLFVCTLSAGCCKQSAQTSRPQTPPSLGVRIDLKQASGNINPLLFGHNIAAADGTGIFNSGLQRTVIATGDGVWDQQRNKPDAQVLKLVEPLNIGSLRYPGGCLVHHFDWKQTIGPLDERPADWRFGLDEFLALCQAWNAQPVITVSDYAGTAQDAADLVEYLNMPALPRYPWAMRRAANGQAQPYAVRWFELGNESEHGNHQVKPFKQFTAQDYAAYFRAYASAMRAVDSSVQLGLVLSPGIDVHAHWNRQVLKLAGDQADFAITHFYAPSEKPAPGNTFDPQMLMRSCMVAGHAYNRLIDEYHQLIREQLGRDLPLAMTEYNISAHQVQGKAWRYSYVAALMNADFQGLMFQPEKNIVLANYWQLVNGYWGMIQTRPDQQLHAAYLMYKLWGQHTGSTLLTTQVFGPTQPYEGYYGFRPMRGHQLVEPRSVHLTQITPMVQPKAVANAYRITPTSDGPLEIQLQDLKQNLYPIIAQVSMHDDYPVDYKLSFEACFEGQQTGAVKLGMGLADDRGWQRSKLAVEANGAQSHQDWQPYTCMLKSLPQTRGVQVVLRLEAAKGSVTGKLRVRKIQLEQLTQQTLPAAPVLTATASLSADRRMLHVILFNKSLDQTLSVPLDLAQPVMQSARYWQVTGKAPDDTGPARLSVQDQPLAIEHSRRLTVELPVASMTAIDLVLHR